MFILGPMGSHWVKKWVETVKITMPQNSNFRLPRGHRFRPKFDFTVMAPNHGGDPPGSILGPMGSNLVKKIGQNRKNYHAPKFEFSTTLRSSISTKIRLYGYGPNHGGDPLGSILGPMGSHWVQKMGQNRKKLPCPKFEFSTTTRSSISTKIRLYGYGAKSRWGPLRVHLGANGVLFGSKKWVETVKITMPQNSNFPLPRGHQFRPKFDLTVMAPNHGGDPLGSILGPMGSHWVKKMGQNRKNYHAPKFEFSTTPRSSISAKIRLYGYGAKSRWGPPRVHLGANGVQFGQKNRSKP